MPQAQGADDRPDPAGGIVHEGHHADLDHLVAAMVEAGRLDIDHDGDGLAGPGPVGGVDFSRSSRRSTL